MVTRQGFRNGERIRRLVLFFYFPLIHSFRLPGFWEPDKRGTADPYKKGSTSCCDVNTSCTSPVLG